MSNHQGLEACTVIAYLEGQGESLLISTPPYTLWVHRNQSREGCDAAFGVSQGETVPSPDLGDTEVANMQMRELWHT